MGLNEWLLFGEALICVGLVISVWRLDKERLLGVIATSLILITTVGGKVITVFGHETNAGNIFYASLFLATYLLIERYGRREGIRTIWWGLVAASAFLALAELSVAFVGSPQTAAFDTALFTVFDRVPRVALASLAAFFISQSVNVHLFTYLKLRFNGRRLWLRTNATNVVAQVLDSVVFFTIAFVGIVPPPHVLDILLTGFFIKVAFIALASPLLYFNRVEHEEEEGGSASILIRYDSRTIA